MRPITHHDHHGPILSFFKAVFRLFQKKPAIVNANAVLSKPAIYVVNHAAAAGPIALTLYFPVIFVPWGHYKMTEGYCGRVRYLATEYYQGKLGYPRFLAWLVALPFAFFSIFLYRALKLIPSYPDVRVRKTLALSIEHLNQKNSLLIFPEDSTDGYLDVLNRINAGFVVLALTYFRDTGIDVPIYPVYYHRQKNVLTIAEPVYVQNFVRQGMARDEIALWFMERMNQLRESVVIKAAV
ncbi:MAG: hypothetical protein V1761_03845 [bacterium]